MSDPYSEMSQVQIDAFLEVPRFAIVATNRADGPPQLTPVWYIYQGRKIYFSTYMKSAKYKNLSRDPRVGICITGDNPDARSVSIYGKTEFTPQGNDRADEIIWNLTRRYYNSDDDTRSYLDIAAANGNSVLAMVSPETVIAYDFN
ncbi:MAG: PPOX class F420-dependent oxidoreductase [Halioglobus sp.]